MKISVGVLITWYLKKPNSNSSIRKNLNQFSNNRKRETWYGVRTNYKSCHINMNSRSLPNKTRCLGYYYFTSKDDFSIITVSSTFNTNQLSTRVKNSQDTYSLIICGCLNSLRFWISRRIFPTTSKCLIFCLFKIFTATLCPVNWWTPTETKNKMSVNQRLDNFRTPSICKYYKHMI